MASITAIFRHLADVTLIVLLGFVYVVLLALGSVTKFGIRQLSSAQTAGRGTVRRVRKHSRGAR